MERYLTWSRAIDFIDDTKSKTVLELGCGKGTRILLNNFKKVYSFEVANVKSWYDKCVTDYQEDKNWQSIFYPMSHFKLDITDKELLDSGGDVRNVTSLIDLYKSLEQFVSIKDVDVALVDQGFHMRGETAAYFLEKNVPIIIIHDINDSTHVYGYDKLVKPDNYSVREYTDTRVYVKE